VCESVCVCVCVCVRVCIVCRLPALDGRKEGNGSLHAHQCAALRVVFLQRFKLHAWICLPLFCSTWCTTGGGSPFLPCFAIKSLTSLFLPLRSKLSSASIPPALSLMSFNPQHEMCRTSQAPCLAAAATATAHRGMRCSWIMPPSQQVLVGARQPQVECHASWVPAWLSGSSEAPFLPSSERTDRTWGMGAGIKLPSWRWLPAAAQVYAPLPRNDCAVFA